MSKFIRCVRLPIELPSFAHLFFSALFASIYSRYMSYSPLKTLHGKLGIADYSE